jgi:hypothetical protein
LECSHVLVDLVEPFCVVGLDSGTLLRARRCVCGTCTAIPELKQAVLNRTEVEDADQAVIVEALELGSESRGVAETDAANDQYQGQDKAVAAEKLCTNAEGH